MTRLRPSGFGEAGAQDERVRAVTEFGFTEGQARFLVLVMRHAGVCVPRQYASFSGIANGGRRCNAFFEKLIRRGYANEIDCVHNRARLYHLQHKSLYYVIGDVASRYRRRVSPRLAVERLMLLDGVLAMPDLEWLTTAAEKTAYLARLTTAGADASREQPAGLPLGTAPRPSSTFPIGLQPDGRVVLLYLATEPWTDGFRTFLQEHAAFFRVAATWTLRLVFPRPLDGLYSAYQAVIREELESPLHAATIHDLQWYFEHRREAAEGPVHPQTTALLGTGAKVFGTTRFTEMYRRWLKQGNAVFEGPSSPVIAGALRDGRGRVEPVVLSHSYRHLFPLVSEAPAVPQRIDKGLRRETQVGTTPPHALNPRPQHPPVESTLTIREQQDRDWHRLNEWYKEQKALGLKP
jgi:hypothetical protein